jgi:hypothetical protein
MPAKLIAGESAAVQRSFFSNHSYPGKTPPTSVKLTGKPCSRRRSAASIATPVPFVGKATDHDQHSWSLRSRRYDLGRRHHAVVHDLDTLTTAKTGVRKR